MFGNKDGEQSASIEELREQAAELGIEVDNRWGEGRLQKEIDAVLGDEDSDEDQESESEQEEKSEPQKSRGDKLVVRNVMKGPQAVGVNILQPKEDLEVTKSMKEDEALMRKVDHALKTGALKKV